MRYLKAFDKLILPFSKIFEAREDPLPCMNDYVVIGFSIGLREDGAPNNLTEAVIQKSVLMASRLMLSLTQPLPSEDTARKFSF